MPAYAAASKRCTCENCIQQDPKGILMEARHIPIHLNRIRHERTKTDSTSASQAQRHSISSQTSSEAADGASAPRVSSEGLKRCICRNCVQQDPRGVLMEARRIPIHLNRIRNERIHAESTTTSPQHASVGPGDTVNDLTGHLFGLTVTDDGPSTQSDASKLWNSRSDFQATSHSSGIIAGALSPIPASEVSDSLKRIVTYRAAPSNESLNRPPSHSAPPSMPRSLPRPACLAGSQRLATSKKDRNVHTIKALKILANIKSRIQRCYRLLLDPSENHLPDLGNELATLRQATEKIRRDSDPVSSHKQDILHSLDELEDELKSRNPQKTSGDPIKIDTAIEKSSPVDRMDVIPQLALVIGIVCSAVMGVSRCGGNFIMGALSLLLYLTLQTLTGTLSLSHENLLRQVPSTIDDATAKLHLTCKTIPYAVCACHCTYPPTSIPGSPTASYPEYCTNFPRPEAACGEPLLEMTLQGNRRPKKSFLYYDFNDYLANLLSRSDIESVMDRSCDELMSTLSSGRPRFIRNVFEADFLREFRGPNPEKLFIDRGDEGHYVFALHVDFFNPEGMNLRGARTSTGIISMACLNLPLEIRYKPENMYLAGVIPGPKQPSLENINHYIRPLMKDLAASWERGVHYSSTANYPQGRTTRSAVALVVCDLPAARHVSALAGIGSHFLCSVCNCYHKSNYGRVDFVNWTRRDKDRLRTYAEQWRDATSTAERERIFKAHGVRYSELWRLPYWDPSKQLVIDSMHCVLEGLVQHHIRSLLGLTTENSSPPSVPASRPAFQYNFVSIDPDIAAVQSITTKETAQISAIHKLLTDPVPDANDPFIVDASMDKLLDSLLRKNTAPLKFVCTSLDCAPAKKSRLYKADYAKALVQWRRNMPFTASPEDVCQFGRSEVLERIRAVIHDMSTPSWLGTVPLNFGDSAAGTIKADEWRSLITVYIPIALISLWGQPNSGHGLKLVLDHTMSLVSVVHLSCARTMTSARTEAYRSCITEYISDLARIHPTFDLRPNHHAAVHIYDFLKLFGPVHSWWAFPFERLIGILQRLPKNHKSGELENTMLLTYLKAAKLRAWLSRPECPQAIQECKVLLDRAYEVRDEVDESDDFWPLTTARETAVPADLKKLIKRHSAIFHARVRQMGIIYSRSSTHLGNSLVLFYPHGDHASPPVPGCIKYIYEVDGTVSLAVQRQCVLPQGSNMVDPFASYPHFPAKTYSSSLSEQLEVIQKGWILAHYARWAVSDDRVVVLSLSRD